MTNRMEEIRKKGFDLTSKRDIQDIYMPQSAPIDYSNIKVGLKSLSDAILTLGDLQKANPRLSNKEQVIRAIETLDYEAMREISNFFYRTSGIYSRLCRYLAYLYCYDWMITPEVNEKYKEDKKVIAKIKDTFFNALSYMDSFEVKKFFGDTALKVIKNGCYYGYLVPQGDSVGVQELPCNYCRSRFSVNGRPAVEFNMKYFDDAFRDATQKMKILNLFPSEFKKGYIAYKEGKLKPDFAGDTSGWYLLDVDSVIKFNMNGSDCPFLISTIPALIDLDAAQDLDRKKMQQKLLKIVIQKIPLDKNGDPIFDVDESRVLHNNAVQMLARAIGLDVLTTFADVEVANTESNNATAEDDSMNRARQSVFDEAGVPQLLFNSEGNIATNNSVLNDEAAMSNLVSQFESFLNMLLRPFNTNSKRFVFKAQILPTTIYNYKELSKLYKEQTQLGYSKILPQVALGQSQSSILANAYFENAILNLSEVFIPPLMSSTMNADTISTIRGTKDSSDKKVGRNEKPDNEKSEKTIANRESMN